jgi:hypothetical protein
MDAGLPPGWVKVGPDADGDYYYWNESTNEVREAGNCASIVSENEAEDVIYYGANSVIITANDDIRIASFCVRQHGRRQLLSRPRPRHPRNRLSHRNHRGLCRLCLHRYGTIWLIV